MNNASVSSSGFLGQNYDSWAGFSVAPVMDFGRSVFDTKPRSIENIDDLMEALGFYNREPSKMAEFLVVQEQDKFAFATAPLKENEESDVGAILLIAPAISDLDEVLSIVRDFEKLADGWDEPGSFAPTHDVVEDALVVLQNWQPSEFIPEPEASADGRIVLEIYDEDGFTLGGVELIGDHRAIYSVNRRTKILGKGSFDTTSQSQIIGALSSFKVLSERYQQP